MAAVTLSEQGDCLQALGQLDRAAAAYEERIRRGEKMEDNRGVAVGKIQLGTVRKDQKRYQDALTAFADARKTFEGLDEPGMVAVAWHQTGIVHENAGDAGAAEQAYRQSLAIRVRLGNAAGQASTLGELGNLYDAMGRLEEAAAFYRQAADKYVEIGDQASEGRDRNNLADTLCQLNRFDEARTEIRRAIECKEPYGHAVLPWTTWAILNNIETAAGQPQAASNARQQAVQAFLAYRRDGGENHEPAGRLCQAVAEALRIGETDEIQQTMQALIEHPDFGKSWKPLVNALQAILQGSRDPALADDPDLDYQNVAEIMLLLEEFKK